MRLESFRTNSYIFGSRVGKPKIVMENNSRDFIILWSDDNNLVGNGPNPNRLSSKRDLSPIHSINCRAPGPGPFTRKAVERIGQAHRVNGSEHTLACRSHEVRFFKYGSVLFPF